jgi:hypothetical protein
VLVVVLPDVPPRARIQIPQSNSNKTPAVENTASRLQKSFSVSRRETASAAQLSPRATKHHCVILLLPDIRIIPPSTSLSLAVSCHDRRRVGGLLGRKESALYPAPPSRWFSENNGHLIAYCY